MEKVSFIYEQRAKEKCGILLKLCASVCVFPVEAECPISPWLAKPRGQSIAGLDWQPVWVVFLFVSFEGVLGQFGGMKSLYFHAQLGRTVCAGQHGRRWVALVGSVQDKQYGEAVV